MVLRPCDTDYGGDGQHHHFYESIKSELESFRLRTIDDVTATATDCCSAATDRHNDDAETSSSIASKKRIDSMFANRLSVRRETAASVSAFGAKTVITAVDERRAKSLAGGGDCSPTRDREVSMAAMVATAADHNDRNTVQEKIEKMFAEISSSELDTDVSMDSTGGGGNKYHVQYIGCAALAGKISSLEGLQRPVRDMYFGYRGGDGPRNFSGLLEISAAGLTIRYRDTQLGRAVHRTDPFATIAVWAALKLVCRRRSSPPSPERAEYEYAFLPLIADPDGSDKAPLFRRMDAGDRARMHATGDDHSPVFAVVMRNAAAGKRLECHGFACESENDALLMAANLYGALVTAMSSSVAAVAAEAERQSVAAAPAKRRVIRQRNGFASMSSTAGSSVAGDDVQLAPALPPPRPPPRRHNSKKPMSTGAVVSSRGSVGPVGDEDGVCSDAKTFRMTVGQPPSLRRGVCNSSGGTGSLRPGGDILTKVAIPRSRSFLKTNGLTKYSRRTAGCGVINSTADRRRRRSSGGSVMGFSDMFDELRAQEGLQNVDDILNAIIDVDGMSFNDLKPIYREFLVKWALTLTKDELYQRAKTIMLEQKRKLSKRGTAATAVTATVAGRGRRLGEKLRNALDCGGRATKAKLGISLLPGFCKRQQKRCASSLSRKKRQCSCVVANGPITVAGRKPDRKNRRTAGKWMPAPKQREQQQLQQLKQKVQQKIGGRRHASLSTCSTSDDSEFFAVALRQRQLQQHAHQQLQSVRKSGGKSRAKSGGVASEMGSGCLHRVSSGYFSCSECSGTGDEKCYCDAGAIAAAPEPASLVSCSCDSDSCADSDKCYCGRRPAVTRTIFDELKSRGFAASESSCASRADSPGTAWKKNELLMATGGGHHHQQPLVATDSGGGSVEPTKSIEYLRMSGRDQHYSSVNKRPVIATAATADRMKVYNSLSSTASSSSLSANTVYSSSIGDGTQHHRRQRHGGYGGGGSSGSDNFRAIDYTLFACSGRKPRDQQRYRSGQPPPSPAAALAIGRSRSSEAVHMSGGCHVYHQGDVHSPPRNHRQMPAKTARRRHSVNDAISMSFFNSDIENSLGYYP